LCIPLRCIYHKTNTATYKGTILFENHYEATGRSQGGKMFWGGAFGMKNAIQQSTKLALDSILSRFMSDLRDQKLAVLMIPSYSNL